MGGIDGYGIAGEPTMSERVHDRLLRDGCNRGLRLAATLCREMARKERAPATQRALRRAARKIEGEII